MRLHPLHRAWCLVLVGLAIVAVHRPAQANPLDPQAFGSNGPNPFSVAGSYIIDTTTGTGILSGPGGSAFGFVTPEAVVVFTFDSVAIGAGVTIRVTGPRPVAILSKTTFSMAAGELNAAGMFVPGVGYQPGAGGGVGAAAAQAATGPGAGGSAWASGGGGGHGTSGGNGGGTGGGVGGIVYGNPAVQLNGGSGGGLSGEGAIFGSVGGAGGGALELGASQSVTVTGGVITVDGSTGYEGGGGGSGGGLLVHAPEVIIGSGAVRASGGAGAASAGAGGGGGGAGRITILNASGSFTPGPTAIIALNGGAGGSGATGPGQQAGSGGLVVGTLGPGPSKVAGCVQLAGLPLAGTVVKFKQRGLQVQTVTDSTGCYKFVDGIANRRGTVTIELPALP